MDMDISASIRYKGTTEDTYTENHNTPPFIVPLQSLSSRHDIAQLAQEHAHAFTHTRVILAPRARPSPIAHHCAIPQTGGLGTTDQCS
eukprot:scaffold13908_cov106-Isochrysis_galbana.AAC.8